MAEVTEESSYAKPSRHRRDRTERSHRRLRDNTGDSPAASTDLNTSNQADSGDINEQFLSPASAERDITPRKDKRRSKRDEPEANTPDEAGSESTPSADTPTRTHKIKKEKKSENTARKRREKKNLREKRRSTGVVIMPTGESDDEEDEEKKALKQHTQQNEQLVVADDKDDVLANAKGVPNIRIDDQVINDSETIEKQKLTEKVEEYEIQIDDFKSKLERANKELEQLRLDNQRLKDENSALLRVVNQLSTKKK